MKKTVLTVGAVTLLTACGSNETGDQRAETAGEVATEAASAETADAAAPPASFAQCRVCHTVEKDGANGVGPNLWNVAGGAAAQKAGFAYSPAMKEAGLTWDDATLHAYLENPFKHLPGTKMAFAGVKDEAKRAELIAYMNTLKD